MKRCYVDNNATCDKIHEAKKEEHALQLQAKVDKEGHSTKYWSSKKKKRNSDENYKISHRFIKSSERWKSQNYSARKYMCIDRSKGLHEQQLNHVAFFRN